MADDLPIELFSVCVHVQTALLLDQVSLRLSAGPPTVVVGPNGSGKTTLLRVAMGLLTPSSGRISWGKQEHSAPLRRAFVFQRPVMLRRRVDENLKFALAAAGVRPAYRSARTQSLLAQVGLAGLAHRPARRLSGGEQQRIAFARALAKEPTVLFLDEPTANLDPAATQSIEQLILDTSARGIKVVLATHDLHEAKRLAGDIVLLHRGAIVENSPVAQFFSQPRTELARRFIAGELLL